MVISQMFRARVAGALYLGVAVTGFFSHAARQRVLVEGDAFATVSHILASPLLCRTSMLSDVAMTALWISTAVTLSVLFRRAVHQAVGMAMVAFVLAGSAAVLASVLMQLAALKLAAGGEALSSLAIEQRHALALLTFEVGQGGVMVASLFFGLWLFPLALMVWRSGSFPRMVGLALGGLLAVAGLGYLADFSLAILTPETSVRFAQTTFWGELLLLLWLLIKGCGPTRGSVRTPNEDTIRLP
jgi:hypothetical protein